MAKAILFLFLSFQNDSTMKKSLLILCLAALLSACTKELPQASYDIIPQPKEVRLSDDQNKAFTLDEKTTIYYETGLQREA